MRTRFLKGMDELKQKLLSMAGLAEQAMERAVRAYHSRDTALCEIVFEGEKAINNIEREIDELALDLLAMQQPMAVDLRFIIAVVKINADLERVGDQAVNIAERVCELNALEEVSLPVDIGRMADTARAMIRGAVAAFIQGDAEIARRVLDMDDSLDAMNRDSAHVLQALIAHRPELTRQAMDAIIISRNLERIGDHATNIAEDVIFWVRGADVRHGHTAKF